MGMRMVMGGQGQDLSLQDTVGVSRVQCLLGSFTRARRRFCSHVCP